MLRGAVEESVMASMMARRGLEEFYSEKMACHGSNELG
jgi:hypothetical protein